MNGIRKRAFERWIYRTRIDIEQWLKNNNIASALEWNEWCDNNKLKRPTPDTIQAHFDLPSEPVFVKAAEELHAIAVDAARATELVPAKKRAPTKKRASKRKKSVQENTEPWHVPAAERPRRKTHKRKKIKTDDS